MYEHRVSKNFYFLIYIASLKYTCMFPKYLFLFISKEKKVNNAIKDKYECFSYKGWWFMLFLCRGVKYFFISKHNPKNLTKIRIKRLQSLVVKLCHVLMRCFSYHVLNSKVYTGFSKLGKDSSKDSRGLGRSFSSVMCHCSIHRYQ